MAVPDTGALQQGHLVAVTCENCELEPLIAKVVQIEEDSIEIEWLEGAYSKPWRNAKQRDPKNHRKVIPWTDVIPKQSIILFAFTLTSSNRLRKATIVHLKEQYQKIRELNNEY